MTWYISSNYEVSHQNTPALLLLWPCSQTEATVDLRQKVCLLRLQKDIHGNAQIWPKKITSCRKFTNIKQRKQYCTITNSSFKVKSNKAHMWFLWICGHHVPTDKHYGCCFRMILWLCHTTGKDGQNALLFKMVLGCYMENYMYCEKCFLCYRNKLAVSWLHLHTSHFIYLNVKHNAFSGKIAAKHEIKDTIP